MTQKTPLDVLKEWEAKKLEDDTLLGVLRRHNEQVEQRKRVDRFHDFLQEPYAHPRGHGGSGTLIIGKRCTNGIVMASDKRMSRGTESELAEKVICKDLGGKVMFAAEGLTGIRDDFFLLLEADVQKRKGVSSLYEVKLIVEDIIQQLTRRYAERVQSDSPIGVLMGGLTNITSGPAQLYYIHSAGYGELVPFYCTGHGGPYAYTLAKFLFDSETLNVEDAARRAAFVISWVSHGELDSTVGGKPQVCILENEKSETRDLPVEIIDKIWQSVEENQCRLADLFQLPPLQVLPAAALEGPKRAVEPSRKQVEGAPPALAGTGVSSESP